VLKGIAMLQLDTYLFFDSNCADAMRFYERTLGGKLDLMTHGDSPMAAQMPPAAPIGIGSCTRASSSTAAVS
jgi:uncharacterized glyoxalase superfamily protein PhnB